MEIRKINLALIIALVAFAFFFLGIWVGQQYLIQEFREAGIGNLCNLLIK